MLQADRYRLEVRFGDELLEAGFTAVPNLVLNNYADLGISDGAAFWIVHLLKFKWTEHNPYPRRSSIPINANRDTQKRYARQLRSLGLLFTRRMYWSLEDNPPDPGLAGKIRALQYDLTSLFHNVVRISQWKAEGYPLDEFQVEIPLEIMEKVVSKYFHHVPKKWKLYCEWKMAAMEGEIKTIEDKAHTEETTRRPGGEKRTIETDELEGENHTVERAELGGENGTLVIQSLEGDNRTTALRVDSQPVENRPHTKENTILNKKQTASTKQQHKKEHTHSPGTVVVVSPGEISNLALTDDQVIVNHTKEQLGLGVMSIHQLVRHELSRRRSEPSYRAEVYYSVEHALGEGPEDWTEQELTKIKRKAALEWELAGQHRRLGAFTLEEALEQYFTPQFTAELLTDKAHDELERIEGWVAYVRRQKNLTTPAGFLRTKIESGETPPRTSP